MNNVTRGRWLETRVKNARSRNYGSFWQDTAQILFQEGYDRAWEEAKNTLKYERSAHSEAIKYLELMVRWLEVKIRFLKTESSRKAKPKKKKRK